MLDAFRNYLLLHISQKFDISLILNYYSHVINLPMNFFQYKKGRGNYLSNNGCV
ncbi:hypothetical protein OL548_03510 [Lysinibacillus sp. MHQ-1]|nr:hypothetical protein OL548_03510 [Lysinibacillus sp. MHQ-1]